MKSDNSQLSRRAQLDKERVISTAKNPIESRLGETLLKNEFFHRRALTSEIGKIQQLEKRHFMHLDQQKKRFLQRHVLPEPTIIVERPPSPGAFETESDDSYLCDPRKPPHYMRPLKSRTKSASYLSTIDMFQVVKKKKVNVWEQAMLERELPHFQSRVLPSHPLSTTELAKLQRGYNLQKKYGLRKSPGSHNLNKPSVGAPVEKDTTEHSTVFLTQLVQSNHEPVHEIETFSTKRSLSSASLQRRKTKLEI